MIRSYGSRLDPYISQVPHVKMQALIKYHQISKIWGEIYSDHIEYDISQDEGDKSDPIMFRQYLANMTEKWASTPENNYSMQHTVITIPQP